MSQAVAEENYTSFRVKDEDFMVVPKKEFLEFKQSQEYPKLYTEVDEEGEWETIDFGPKGIDSCELIDHLRT